MKLSEATPFYVGPCGNAYVLNLNAADMRSDEVASAWAYAIIVNCPISHPWWPTCTLSIYSLGDVPGLPPAKIYLPGATHEIMLLALNPEKEVHVDRPVSMLYPANFAAQMICRDDDEALEVIEKTARDCCDGILNPDTDGRQRWIARFGDNMIRR